MSSVRVVTPPKVVMPSDEDLEKFDLALLSACPSMLAPRPRSRIAIADLALRIRCRLHMFGSSAGYQYALQGKACGRAC